jgi:Beta-lactamase superfamily domain
MRAWALAAGSCVLPPGWSRLLARNTSGAAIDSQSGRLAARADRGPAHGAPPLTRRNPPSRARPTLDAGFRVYYAGDTGLTAEMAVIRDYWKPDLAILPVGGSTLCMDPEQAAYAAGTLLQVRHVVPCHWFPPPDEAPEPDLMRRLIASAAIRGASGHQGQEFAELMRDRYPDVTVSVLELGDAISIDLSRGASRARR